MLGFVSHLMHVIGLEELTIRTQKFILLVQMVMILLQIFYGIVGIRAILLSVEHTMLEHIHLELN